MESNGLVLAAANHGDVELVKYLMDINGGSDKQKLKEDLEDRIDEIFENA